MVKHHFGHEKANQTNQPPSPKHWRPEQTEKKEHKKYG